MIVPTADKLSDFELDFTYSHTTATTDGRGAFELRDVPATLIQGHGTFVKGRSLEEALFRVCLADNSGYVARLASRVGVDTTAWRAAVAPNRWLTSRSSRDMARSQQPALSAARLRALTGEHSI